MASRHSQLLNERWRVISPVSAGGQGQVYTVVDSRTSEKCAAKVFRLKGYEGQKLARAKVEIDAIKKLKGSANVVQIKDENISEAPGGAPIELFYVMDYAPHGSLADNDFYIGDVEQSLRMFKQILIGVREAHRKGVIHRDLKPANILLYPTQREIVITDFGLGLIKDRESEQDITEPDELLGPRFFMAPEQHTNPSSADERSDIYSLGKVLYYMLTGKGKVYREKLDDINKELSEPNPCIPQVQELLLNRMVVENPADRFVDVSEIIDEVDGIITHIEAASRRYLKPNSPRGDVYGLLVGSRRDMFIGRFRQDLSSSLRMLENAVTLLRKDGKARTLGSLKDDLLERYPNGKVNAAVKSVIAYIADPEELASSQTTSRFSFPSYYMARYYIQSRAFDPAHAYIVKALEIEKDPVLQLDYLLIFEEVCRKCNCVRPHDFEGRILPLLRKAAGPQKAELLKTLGKHFLDLGDKRRGLRLLEAYLESKPYDHNVRFDCAFGYAALEESGIGLAIHHYLILISHIPDNAKALNNLGAAYQQQGLVSESLAKYREASALGFTISASNIAKRYIDVGMLEEAKKLLDDAILEYPTTYHENIAVYLGEVVKKRQGEAKRREELAATGSFLSRHHVQAIRSLTSNRQTSWVGKWRFDDVEFECLPGILTIKSSKNFGEFKAVVSGSCLEVSNFKKRYEQTSSQGIFYLASDNRFSGYLITEKGVCSDIDGTQL